MMDIFIRLPLSAHADRIGVARIFRGCVRPGVHPGFVVGGRWRGRRPRERRGRREAPERPGGGIWAGAP